MSRLRKPGRTQRVWAAASSAVAAAIGSRGARDAKAVYARLEKPRWAPPAWVFGPAWTLLYGLNAWAGERTERTSQRVLHTAQLALNAAWTPTFFRAGHRRKSLALILALDALVLAEISSLRRTSPAAAWALVPYLAWLGYATALTASVGDPRPEGR